MTVKELIEILQTFHPEDVIYNVKGIEDDKPYTLLPVTITKSNTLTKPDDSKSFLMLIKE